MVQNISQPLMLTPSHSVLSSYSPHFKALLQMQEDLNPLQLTTGLCKEVFCSLEILLYSVGIPLDLIHTSEMPIFLSFEHLLLAKV